MSEAKSTAIWTPNYLHETYKYNYAPEIEIMFVFCCKIPSRITYLYRINVKTN